MIDLTDLPFLRPLPGRAACVGRRRSMSLVAIAFGLVLANAGGAATQPLPPGHVDDFAGKPRVIVLTDMGNEPDDQMSFVRLLLYSNELDLESLIAGTSTWQRDKVQPDVMRKLIAAYREVRPNLLQHAAGWPEAATLDAMVASGQRSYGMAAVGSDKMSPGAEAIVRAGDRSDPRPLWVTIWGGANTLAQAPLHVRATRSPAEVDKFVVKLRVSAICDQDDAGPWIRREFPQLLYIVKPSGPDGGDYYYATWTGISGDVYYRNGAGADPTTVTNEWLDEHIRAKGPLGKLYPKFAFIIEGDTPSFLGLTNSGLNSYRNPGWGGWGGRYVYRQPYGETRPIWTRGGDLFGRVTSQDSVSGIDGKTYADANHNPIVAVNGKGGPHRRRDHRQRFVGLDLVPAHHPERTPRTDQCALKGRWIAREADEVDAPARWRRSLVRSPS